VSSYDARFERELKKRIGAELARLREVIEVGVAITDHAKYQNYIGQIAALKRVTDEYCQEVQTNIDKG
jgi:hypothetical protein